MSDAFRDAEVLCLDLEGTLVSNAISCFPRPGLKEFAETCRASFARVVMYSTVRSELVRDILKLLEDEGNLPAGFAAAVEIVRAEGGKKDLRLIVDDPATAVLIDDSDVAVPGQEDRVVRIAEFQPPFDQDDDALVAMAETIRRLRA
jgi:hypothetical protein